MGSNPVFVPHSMAAFLRAVELKCVPMSFGVCLMVLQDKQGLGGVFELTFA